MDSIRNEDGPTRSGGSKAGYMPKVRILRRFEMLEVWMPDAGKDKSGNKRMPDREVGAIYRDFGLQSNPNESAGILSSSFGS